MDGKIVYKLYFTTKLGNSYEYISKDVSKLIVHLKRRCETDTLRTWKLYRSGEDLTEELTNEDAFHLENEDNDYDIDPLIDDSEDI